MGQLADGKWSNENILSNHDKTGLYYKRDSVFRSHISSDPKSGLSLFLQLVALAVFAFVVVAALRQLGN